MFLVIDADEGIYPCQRLCGRSDYRMGSLSQDPKLDDLYACPAARRMAERERLVHEACHECPHYAYCKGGCAYNAAACDNAIRDPYCEAYQTFFCYIKDRLAAEMRAEENIAAIVERPLITDRPILHRKGPLIELVRSRHHPTHTARTAKRIIAAYELGRDKDTGRVAKKLSTLGVCRTLESAENSLQNLTQYLWGDGRNLNKLYLHVTFACQLHCKHCYASADPITTAEFPAHALPAVLSDAQELGLKNW